MPKISKEEESNTSGSVFFAAYNAIPFLYSSVVSYSTNKLDWGEIDAKKPDPWIVTFDIDDELKPNNNAED